MSANNKPTMVRAPSRGQRLFLAAALLQVLLRLTLHIEHRIANYFKAKGARVRQENDCSLRGLCCSVQSS
jgi:hypothetical protein